MKKYLVPPQSRVANAGLTQEGFDDNGDTSSDESEGNDPELHENILGSWHSWRPVTVDYSKYFTSLIISEWRFVRFCLMLQLRKLPKSMRIKQANDGRGQSSSVPITEVPESPTNEPDDAAVDKHQKNSKNNEHVDEDEDDARHSEMQQMDEDYRCELYSTITTTTSPPSH
ncbi:hypothetical protein BGZ58_010175 [Dissophora ornata]|nr:hypothetical protein BGZ58_010175 [Dissophora ornata]